MLTHFNLSLISKISLGIVGSLLLSLFNFQGSVLHTLSQGRLIILPQQKPKVNTFFHFFLKNFKVVFFAFLHFNILYKICSILLILNIKTREFSRPPYILFIFCAVTYYKSWSLFYFEIHLSDILAYNSKTYKLNSAKEAYNTYH